MADVVGSNPHSLHYFDTIPNSERINMNFNSVVIEGVEIEVPFPTDVESLVKLTANYGMVLQSVGRDLIYLADAVDIALDNLSDDLTERETELLKTLKEDFSHLLEHHRLRDPENPGPYADNSKEDRFGLREWTQMLDERQDQEDDAEVSFDDVDAVKDATELAMIGMAAHPGLSLEEKMAVIDQTLDIIARLLGVEVRNTSQEVTEN